VTRVLPAFVVALLAIAPSVSGGIDASADCAAACAVVLARGSADALVWDRAFADLGGFGRERAPSPLDMAPAPAQASVSPARARARDLGMQSRVVDGRALARRTFATQRAVSHASDDPDAAA